MAQARLAGKTIAVLATDGFEQVELEKPLAALKEAGAVAHVVAPKAGQIQGFEHHDKGRPVSVDKTLAEARPEDYDGLGSPTDRIFNYEVKDGNATSGKTVKEVKDFGPWKASGAQFKAYVDTVPITVTAGQITIKFTPQVENPQINAIEIVPR